MPRRFIDASVFVHAYLRPRRALKPHERAIKGHARTIVARIEHEEEVAISTVHLGEIANVLEEWMRAEDARAVLRELVTRDNIEVLPVGRDDFLEAMSLGSEAGAGTTDALAAVLMGIKGITEIYSFDRAFDRVEGLNRITR
ncbi:MAG TPA: type II toxin-antitoxin system VapC family toxin [Thermoplasmata archaeon]